MLINQSGSTKDGRREKVRSGQSYLYKKYGMESEVIEVRFRDKVSGSLLNQALLQTGKRYPYFNTKLIEKGGVYASMWEEYQSAAQWKVGGEA